MKRKTNRCYNCGKFIKTGFGYFIKDNFVKYNLICKRCYSKCEDKDLINNEEKRR